MKYLTHDKLARVKGLLAELHSITALVEKIDGHLGPDVKETDELKKLAKELTDGLDVAHKLAKALNHTALAIHVELVTRRRA